MLRLRIRAGVLAFALLSAGCGAAAPSPPAVPTPTAPGPVAPTPAVSPDQDAALAELCDPQQEASMANLAGQLEGLNETDDSRALSGPLDRASSNLQVLTLGPDGMSLRDSAVGLMGDLAAGIDDPATRSSTAIAAAQTLRGLEIQVCPPAER